MANFNFNNVKGVTFNGNTVARILFNGVNVWESGGIEIMRKIIGGNWKMNMTGDVDIQNWVDQMRVGYYNAEVEVIVFPQACLISKFKDAIGNGEVGGCKIKIGAQLCSENEKGAFTGQNSIDALMACGAEYFLTGHNEVRNYQGVTSEEAIEQALTVMSKGGKAIYCIPLRAENMNNVHDVNNIIAYFEEELRKVADRVNHDDIFSPFMSERKFTFCYTPEWAMEMGGPMTREILSDHASWFEEAVGRVFARDYRYYNFIHDGSVNPSNIKELLDMHIVVGAVAGGASLKPDYFSDMIEQISNMA